MPPPAKPLSANTPPSRRTAITRKISGVPPLVTFKTLNCATEFSLEVNGQPVPTPGKEWRRGSRARPGADFKRAQQLSLLVNGQQIMSSFKLAEREGFEPSVGYKPTHAFQACAFNRSATSPFKFLEQGEGEQRMYNPTWFLPWIRGGRRR